MSKLQKAFSLLLLWSVCICKTASAAPMWNWFDGHEIDYWNEGRRTRDLLTEPAFRKSMPPTMSLRAMDAHPFEWKNYDDPSSVTFWDDGGDYVPPRPIRELAANPTSENFQKYRQWQKKKIELSMRLATLMTADAEKQKLEEQRRFEHVKEKIKWEQVSVYYFYSSTCGVCRSQVPLVEELQSRGVQVTLVQLDWKTAPALHAKSLNYDEGFKKTFEVEATPTMVIYYRQKVSRIVGGTNLQDIKNVLK